jgi:serine/threonine protein kinase
MFINELGNLKRLKHAHLVRLVGSYTDLKYTGLLMEPIADCDLKHFLSQNSTSARLFLIIAAFFRMSCVCCQVFTRKQMSAQRLEARKYSRQRDNLLITDFGTARDWSDGTRGTMFGRSAPFTPDHAAPEVVDQDSRGTLADMWSLGCIFLDIMVGTTFAAGFGSR